MRTRLLTALLIAAGLLGAAVPGARAAFFPGDVIDAGPGLTSVQAADLARDGTGAVAYLRSDGGADHLFVGRIVNGSFQGPERADPGVPEAASSAGIVALEGGRLIAAWNAGGRLMVSSRGLQEPGWPAPIPVYDERAAGRTVTNVSVDASIYGRTYIAFTTTGPGGADVRVARVANGQWITDPAVLDVNPAANAGEGALKRPDISTSADGGALAVWGEDGSDGLTHVFARRITRRGVATTVREVSLPSLDGRRALGADSADVSLENDSSYAWVAFRQTVDDGGRRGRVIARRLVGSEFDPPVGIDGLGPSAPESATSPRLSVDGRGRGIATSGRDPSFQTVGSLVRRPEASAETVGSTQTDEVFQPAMRLDSLPNAASSFAAPAASEGGRVAVAWQQTAGPGAAGEIRAKAFGGEGAEPEALLSRPELGSAAAARGLAAASDRPGNTIVAFLQGTGGDVKLVAAVEDRPPGPPRVRTSSSWTRNPRPRIAWGAASDQWGPLLYQVFLGPLVVATTGGSSFQPAVNLPDADLPFRIVAIDRRGQATSTTERRLRIDTTPPGAILTPLTVRSGRAQRFSLALLDLAPTAPGAIPAQGSGVVRVRFDFGDRSRPVTKESPRVLTELVASHVYRTRGRFEATARLVDKAGNVGKVTFDVRVR